MKVTEHNTCHVKANVYPHGHKDMNSGPWKLRIGIQSQPEVMQSWDSENILVSLEQTEKETNFTLIRVMLLRIGTKTPSFVAGCKFSRARFYRKPASEIEIRLKKKLGNSLSHPVPVGKYDGSCMYDAGGGFAVFTLQACTLRKEAEPSQPKTIITPGDAEYGITLRDAERTLSGNDELDRRGTDAGGLRDGELPDGVPPRGRGESVGRPLWTPGDRED